MLEKALVLSDIHFANAKNKYVDLIAFGLGKDLDPDLIFLNGDIIDLYAVSRYPKHPRVKQALAKDLKRTKEFLVRLRKEHPKAEIIYVFGNHEHRLEAYMVANAPDLYPFLNLEDLLGTQALKIKVIRSQHKENWYKHKNLYVGHFDKALSNAGSTAQALLRDKGVSLLQGHIHRVGMTGRRFLDRTLYAYENPCLANMDVDYVKDPNWMHGASVLYFDAKEHWWYPIVLKRGKVIWQGKEYKA